MNKTQGANKQNKTNKITNQKHIDIPKVGVMRVAVRCGLFWVVKSLDDRRSVELSRCWDLLFSQSQIRECLLSLLHYDHRSSVSHKYGARTGHDTTKHARHAVMFCDVRESFSHGVTDSLRTGLHLILKRLKRPNQPECNRL